MDLFMDFMEADWDSSDSSVYEFKCPTMDQKYFTDAEMDNVSYPSEEDEDICTTADDSQQESMRAQKASQTKSETDGSTKRVNSKSASSHQKSLDQLKEKDPEFYEFLQQEDDSLLHFDDGKFALEDDSSDYEQDVHQLPDELEEASDSDLEYDTDDVAEEEEVGDAEDVTKEGKGREKERITVTKSMAEQWKTKLIGPKSSLPAMKNLMQAFHSAIARFGDDGDKKKDKKRKLHLKYRVENSGTFNAVVGLCIRQVIPSLTKLLDYHPDKKSKKLVLPYHTKSWAKVRELVRSYLDNIVALNQLLLEPTVKCTALRHTILLVPYFVCFPKNTKQLLRFLIKSWSSAEDESVRVLAFLCINRIVKYDRSKYLEPTLRQCYLAYVANCKFTTPTLLPMINFMQQTLSELFSISPSLAYQLSFLYIRQLAIHLRKAITVPRKENYQAVYNWQYVHCIGLWCHMVGKLHSSDKIKPLLYPLVQVSLGTIDLVPTTRYFPLRYHIIRYLTALSNATNTYIPLLPYITKPLKLAEFCKKKGGLISEPLNFSTILKLSNSQLKESAYRASTMDEVYHALMEYVNSQAHTISFPEMMIPTLIFLKKYTKSCKMPNYIKLIRQIIEKIEENSKCILERRSQVKFVICNAGAANRWESEQKKVGVPFHKHYQHYKSLHQKEKHHIAADKNRNVEERLPKVDRRKFLEVSESKDKEELGTLFGQDDDDEDIEFNLETILESKNAAKRKATNKDSQKSEVIDEEFDSEIDVGSDVEDLEKPGKKQPEKIHLKPVKRRKIDDREDEPDVVEDFQFSSDED